MMRGNLQLLGGTNVTYVMKDSPLTVHNRLSDLVTFTSFEDTLVNRRRQEAPLPLGGLDMLLTIRIDQSVRLNADITPDRSSKVELEGGGDLSFNIPAGRDDPERTIYPFRWYCKICPAGHPAERI